LAPTQVRTHGTYDARALLSPPTVSIYTAITEVLRSQITPGRPMVWDDADRPLDKLVEQAFPTSLDTGGSSTHTGLNHIALIAKHNARRCSQNRDALKILT
jgi:hypothetical protein